MRWTLTDWGTFVAAFLLGLLAGLCLGLMIAWFAVSILARAHAKVFITGGG